MRKIAEAQKSPVNISLHPNLSPPPLIPLLAGQCLSVLKNKTETFYSEAREVRGRGVMTTVVGFNSLTEMNS